jgi:hypothetical protein
LGEAGNESQRVLNRRLGQILRHAQPTYECRRPRIEPSFLETAHKIVALEVNGYEDEALGFGKPKCSQPPLFPSLRARVIDLKHANPREKIRPSPSEGIESGPEDQVLSYAAPDRLL